MTMPQVSDVGKLIILLVVVIGMFGIVIAGQADFLQVTPFLTLIVGFLIGNGKAALNSHAPSPVLVSHVKPNEVVTIEGSYPVERKNVA